MPLPLYLPKGRVSRITNREPVNKGTLYVACHCKQCSAPMHLFYVLHAPPQGTAPFVGEGKISVPCRHCKHDDVYDASDFNLLIADTDLPATHEPRVEPSDMPRQPLLRTKYKDAKTTFGPHALEDRPKAAALVARIIGISSEIDAAIAFLLAQMMGTNTAPAVALFMSLRQGRMQLEALNAVASVVLNDQDRELFAVLMSLRSGADNERDSLAHGRFGESPAIPEGVVWIDAFDYLRYSVRVENEAVTEEATQWFRERVYVYELAHLERIARNGEALFHSIRSFTGYLRSDDAAWRAERYPQLCAEPHVQQALSQLREGAKKKTTSSHYRILQVIQSDLNLLGFTVAGRASPLRGCLYMSWLFCFVNHIIGITFLLAPCPWNDGATAL